MRIVRYQDQTGHAVEQPGGGLRKIAGDIFGEWQVATEPADVRKLLAPVAPAVVFATGLNYLETRIPNPSLHLG